MDLPQTFSGVIELWPTAVELSKDIAVKEVTVRAWKARGIPAEYWADIVASAAQRNIEGVTFELLAGIASNDRKRASSDPEPRVA